MIAIEAGWHGDEQKRTQRLRLSLSAVAVMPAPAASRLPPWLPPHRLPVTRVLTG